MRLVLLPVFIFSAMVLRAQNDIGWMAPEGKIINNRTLTWNDFQGEEDKKFADELAERNLRARAYVCPAIYFKADSGVRGDNGRVTFRFKVKCAFQSRAFVRESTKKEHSNYVLIHEQDHYDIALNFANKLQRELSSRDYSDEKYNEEIDKIYHDLMDKHYKIQEQYDNEVNPDGRDEVEKQRLWDMRIRKCCENNTDEFYASAESVVQSVKAPGQIVKRIPGESIWQFVTRVRPLYTELPQEFISKAMEISEWGQEPAVLAFYTQKHYVFEDGTTPKDNFRTFAYLFVPTVKDTYKRVLVDTFENMGLPVKINTAFLANADSDNVKELVIMAVSPQKEKGSVGTMHINKVFDAIAKPYAAKMKRLDAACAKIEGGFEGTVEGKASKAKCRSEAEVREALKKAGYQ